MISEIEDLTQKLQIKHEELIKAAQYGNSLLETNSYLQNQLQETHLDYEKKLEEIEQEKYELELKLKIRQKSENEGACLEEKKALLKEHNKQLELMTKTHSSEITNLKAEINALQKEIDEAAMINSQQREKIEKQQKLISELKSSYKKDVSCDSISPDVAELMQKNKTLQLELQLAQEKYEEIYCTTDQLHLEVSNLTKSNDFLREEKALLSKENESYREALEQFQQEIRELKSELDSIQSAPQNPNSKGNSLFAEVEDKRIQAEKRLISLQVKMKCMERKYTQQVNYTLQLKTQIAQLLQSGGSDADRDQICRLEQALLNSRGDVKSLMDSIAELEAKLASKTISVIQEMKKENSNNEDFVGFLEDLLEKKDAEMVKLKEKLQKSQMHLMAESRKVSEVDKDVYEVKTERDKLKSLFMKQKMEISRLKLKCGENVSGKRNIIPGKIEKLPTSTISDFSSTSCITTENKENNTPYTVTNAAKKEKETANAVETSNAKHISVDSKSSAGEGKLRNVENSNDCPAECKQQ